MQQRFKELFFDFSQYKYKIPVCGCILLNHKMNKVTAECIIIVNVKLGRRERERNPVSVHVISFSYFFPLPQVLLVCDFNSGSWMLPRGKINENGMRLDSSSYSSSALVCIALRIYSSVNIQFSKTLTHHSRPNNRVRVRVRDARGETPL